MNRKQLENELNKVKSQWGEWTTHNIRLDKDFYTVGRASSRDELRIRRVLQIASDVCKKPLSELRVLDLASSEGLYATEFARQGSRVVGIEGTVANIEKAKFAKRVLGLRKLDFFQDDVRNLSKKKYGEFDVVLCLEVLYRLDVPDIFKFISKMRASCKQLLILDTQVSEHAKERLEHDGQEYFGSFQRKTTGERSFWFTRRSIYNALTFSGFTSVYECNVPAEPEKPCERVTLIALAGKPVPYHSAQKFPNGKIMTWNETLASPTSESDSDSLPNLAVKQLKKLYRRYVLPQIDVQ